MSKVVYDDRLEDLSKCWQERYRPEIIMYVCTVYVCYMFIKRDLI